MNQCLTKFWSEIGDAVLGTPTESMLRDMARLDITLKAHSLPKDETEKVNFNVIFLALDLL